MSLLKEVYGKEGYKKIIEIIIENISDADLRNFDLLESNNMTIEQIEKLKERM